MLIYVSILLMYVSGEAKSPEIIPIPTTVETLGIACIVLGSERSYVFSVLCLGHGFSYKYRKRLANYVINMI